METAETPQKKVQMKSEAILGKRILVVVKQSDLDNELPGNAWEADVLRELQGYAQMNITMPDGSVVCEWKAIKYLRVISIMGPAQTSVPAPQQNIIRTLQLQERPSHTSAYEPFEVDLKSREEEKRDAALIKARKLEAEGKRVA